MAITFPAYTRGTAASGTSMSVTKPSGLADDDYLLFLATKDDNAGSFSSSGFTFTNFASASQDDKTIGFGYKKITNAAGEASSYTLSWSPDNESAVANLFIVRGADLTDFLDVTYVQGTHGVETDDVRGNDDPAVWLTAQPITTATDDAMVVIFAGSRSDALPNLQVEPTGYTGLGGASTISDGWDREGQGNGDAQYVGAYKEVATAGTETPANWGDGDFGDARDWVAITFAIKPAGTGSFDITPAAVTVTVTPSSMVMTTGSVAIAPTGASVSVSAGSVVLNPVSPITPAAVTVTATPGTMELGLTTINFEWQRTGDSLASTTASVGTMEAPGTDTYMYVIANSKTTGGPGTLTATYDGASMTQLATSLYGVLDEGRVTAFGLLNPAAGAATVEVTSDQTEDEISFAATAYSGIDQQNPVDTALVDVNDNTTTTVVTINSELGDMVICSVTAPDGLILNGANQQARVYQNNLLVQDSQYISEEHGGLPDVLSEFSWATARYSGAVAVNLNQLGYQIQPVGPTIGVTPGSVVLNPVSPIVPAAVTVTATPSSMVVTVGSVAITPAAETVTVTAGSVVVTAAGNAPEYDANSQGGDTATTTLTVAHTTSGTDRFLLVAVSTYTDGGPTTLTAEYNSVSMTEIGTTVFGTSDHQRFSLFGLANPTVGNNNIVVTAAATADELDLAAASYTNVDQTTPTDTATVQVVDNVDTSSMVITSEVNDLVVDGVAWFNGTLTEGAGQTQRVIDDNTSASTSEAISDEDGAASVTMSQDFAIAEYIAHIGVNLNVAAAAADNITPAAVTVTATPGSMVLTTGSVPITPAAVTVTVTPAAMVLTSVNDVVLGAVTVTVTPQSMVVTTGSVSIVPAAASVAVTAGTMVLSTTAPVTPDPTTVTVTPSTVVLTALAAISPAAATVTITGSSVVLTTGSVPITPAAVSVTVTPASMVLTVGSVAITPDPVTVTVTPSSLDLNTLQAVAPGGATVTVTPSALDLNTHQSIALTGPTVTVTEGTMVLTTTYPLSPDAVTVTVTPQSMVLTVGSVAITPDAVTVTVTPSSMVLTQGQNITPTGPTVSVSAGSMVLTTGSVPITPAAVTVNVTPQTLVVTNQYPISAAAASVTVTPQTMTVTTGSVSIVPDAATVSVTAGSLSITTGSVAITPAPVTVTATPGAMVLATEYTLSPASATVTVTPSVTVLTTGSVPITLASASVSATPSSMVVTVGSVSIAPAGVTVNVSPSSVVLTAFVGVAPDPTTVTVTAGSVVAVAGQPIEPDITTVVATSGSLAITTGSTNISLTGATVTVTSGTVTLSEPGDSEAHALMMMGIGG